MISHIELLEIAHQQLIATYNLPLVLASYIVAAVAAFSSIRLARYAEHDLVYDWRWLIAGGLTMGFGVWAMHFIGMLAFRLPIAVSYDMFLTVVSVVPAIIGCTIGLALLRKSLPDSDSLRRLLSGTIIGAGIGAMHYTGMAAMRMNAELFYDQRWFILSILVAVVLGIVGVFAEKLRDYKSASWLAMPFQIASAAILGLSVSGMHYVAMQATICIPTANSYTSIENILSPVALSVNVSLASIIIAVLALVAVRFDVKMKKAQKSAAVTQERMFSAIESIGDGFLLFDEDGALLMHNKIFAGMYPNLKAHLKPGTSYESLLRYWVKDREKFPDELDQEDYVQKCLEAFRNRTYPVSDSDEDKLFDGRWAVVSQNTINVGGLVSVWHDVTAIKNQQDMYKEMAMTDGLTKLANRAAFIKRLVESINRNKRLGKKVALMFLDLDKFKPVNDQYGHDAGDFVLCTIADRLSALMRETDMVARIGGDEFVVILEQINTFDDIEMIARKVLETIHQPIVFNGQDCSVGGSIGISVNPDHAKDEDTLIKLADDAMYKVKEAGRNNFRIYDQGMTAASSAD